MWKVNPNFAEKIIILDSGIIERLAARLKQTLPGENAQLLMGSNRRLSEFRLTSPNENTRLSSVMILLFPHNGELYSVFIKRNEYKGVHGGHISLPGGKFESFDNTAKNTALRETYEEIGVRQDEILVLGELTKIFIPPSNFIVYPFLGFINYKPIFIPQIKEVAEIFDYPVKILLDRNTIKNKEFLTFDGLKFIAPYYDIANQVVWGATAMILSEFAEILKEAGLKI